MLCSARRAAAARVGDDPLLVGDLPRQQFDVILDARPVRVVARRRSRCASARRSCSACNAPAGERATQVARSRAMPASKSPLKSMYCRGSRRNGSSASRWSRTGTIGFLYLSARVHSCLQVECVFDAVAGHDEDQALAIADRLGELHVPIAARLQVALSSQTEIGGGPASNVVVPASERTRGINRGVADEVVDGHGWAFCVSAKTRDLMLVGCTTLLNAAELLLKCGRVSARPREGSRRSVNGLLPVG